MMLTQFVVVSALLSQVSPLEKTITLLTDLQQKVVSEGEEQGKLYEAFKESCKDTAKDTQFSMTTSTSKAEGLKAKIDQATATVSEFDSKTETLVGEIAANEGDLASATALRKKEAEDFAAADAEMAETVDMLERAISIIEKEMKGGSFFQGQSQMSDKVTNALKAILGLSTVDPLSIQQLDAFMQDTQQPTGAPAAAAYESHSSGILETLEGMLETAKTQRSEAQKKEMTSKFDFDMLKQKLDDEIAVENKELKEAKQASSEAAEAKASAQKDLEVTEKGLAAAGKKLKDLQQECMSRSEDYETEQKERADELEALATAKKIIEEKTGGAAARAYSFLQTKSDNTGRVIAYLQGLSRRNHFDALMELASRMKMAQAMSADPFAKIKGMIQEMIDTLVAEAEKEASHKAYCDKEMSETKAKKADKEEEVESLNTSQDQDVAKIAKLNEGVSTLQAELAKIAAEQKAATDMRMEEKAAWTKAKADYEAGLEGVGMALQVLRDYYAKKESLVQAPHTDAATGIIGMLEVVESDFSKLLAEGSAAESQAESEYEQATEDNKVATATKQTEVKYKQKDLKETESRLENTKSDLAAAQAELDAILEYYDQLKPQCIAKPEPYAVRKERREKEIAGLKQALSILEGEAVGFMQLRRA